MTHYVKQHLQLGAGDEEAEEEVDVTDHIILPPLDVDEEELQDEQDLMEDDEEDLQLYKPRGVQWQLQQISKSFISVSVTTDVSLFV